MIRFQSFWPIAIAVVYLTAMGLLARRFPPVNPDEIIVMVNGYNYLHGRGIRYSLNDNLYPQSIYPLRDLSNHIARPLFDAWAGLWVFLGQRNVWPARASALGLGVVTLLLFYLMGQYVAGPRLGILMMGLCLFNPVFLAASCVVNEHMMLLFLGSGLLLFLMRFPHLCGWTLFAFGTCAAFSLLLVHQNGILLLGALLIIWSMVTLRAIRPSVLIMIAGFGTGALLSLVFVDLPRIVLYQRAIYWNFAKPPFLQWPWHLGIWLMETLRNLLSGTAYYFFSEALLPRDWEAAQIVYWASAGFLAYGYVRENSRFDKFSKPFLIALTISILGMTLLVQRREVFYLLTLLPLIVPWLGFRAEYALRNRKWTVLLGGCCCLAGSAFLFSRFAYHYAKSCKPLSQIFEEIDARIPNEPLKIAGPNVLWSHYPVSDFRDIDATVTARYFVRSSLSELLKIWKPDIIIVGGSFRRAYDLPPFGADILSKLVGVPANSLGSIDTANAYGRFDLYRLVWPRSDE